MLIFRGNETMFQRNNLQYGQEIQLKGFFYLQFKKYFSELSLFWVFFFQY